MTTTPATQAHLPDDTIIAAAARQALGEWLAWPDAGRDGPREVTNERVKSWLSGLPNKLASLTNEAARHRQAHSLPGDVGTDSLVSKREYLLLSSYCDGENEADCNNARPCSACLAMCNIFKVADPDPVYLRMLGENAAALTPSAPEPVQKLHELLAKASALQIGPSNEGHRIAIYFDDHNEAGKLFAVLSDRAALATEAE